MGIFTKIFGTHSDREIKRLGALIAQIEDLGSKYSALSEAELTNTTSILRARIENGETADDILPDAFAAVREAAYRVLGMRHYTVQLIGGVVLHQGRRAEMKTGE